MTLQRGGAAPAFSASAEAYVATMLPALRPVAEEVVRRARLAPDELVLDVGTGTGNAAAMARGAGRRVIGVDAAPGMLAVARREVPGVEFVEGDFAALPFQDATADVVLAVHALLFSDDRLSVLREWRRVTRPDGRISLSVPGPNAVVPLAIFGEVFARYGITSRTDDYPTLDELASWADAAGWRDVETAADPAAAIPLRDEAHFREWLQTGARGRATGEWDDDRRTRFVHDLMAVSPRDAEGGYRLPFGALYLSGRNPPG